MTPPSYAKFGKMLRPDGKLIVNSSLIKIDVDDPEIHAVTETLQAHMADTRVHVVDPQTQLKAIPVVPD